MLAYLRATRVIFRHGSCGCKICHTSEMAFEELRFFFLFFFFACVRVLSSLPFAFDVAPVVAEIALAVPLPSFAVAALR